MPRVPEPGSSDILSLGAGLQPGGEAMRGRTYPQYGNRTSEQVRAVLLAAALGFVQRASQLPGVLRIALIGSLATQKRFPKDVDLLVTVADELDLRDLAGVGRQLAGSAQQINGGADVFIASPAGEYLGRACPWRRCGPGIRAGCGAAYQSGREFLRDDLHTIDLPRELIASPAFDLWPNVLARVAIPSDVEALLLRPLAVAAAAASAPNAEVRGAPGGP